MAKRLSDAYFARLSEEEQRILKQARSLTSWMDDKISLGGFGVGLDGLFGILPVGGDLISAAIGLHHVYVAHKLKLGLGTQISVIINIALDFLVGLVPILGDVADFVFKSYRRNQNLIERKLAARMESSQ